MWLRMGSKLVATWTEYMIAGILIHLQLPASKEVFHLLDIITHVRVYALLDIRFVSYVAADHAVLRFTDLLKRRKLRWERKATEQVFHKI